ncbi:PqqD family protein [Thermodesulfobacteriota bacterium]
MDNGILKPKARDGVTVQNLGDEVLLYDTENDTVHVLNHTAYAIWDCCTGSNTVEDILETLSNKFPEVLQHDLKADMEATLQGFKEKKIVL